jgi:hypothetical protein
MVDTGQRNGRLAVDRQAMLGDFEPKSSTYAVPCMPLHNSRPKRAAMRRSTFRNSMILKVFLALAGETPGRLANLKWRRPGLRAMDRPQSYPQ